MAGGDATAVSGDAAITIQALFCLVRDVVRISDVGFSGGFKRDCSDLSRRIALLSHLLEEIKDSMGDLRPLDVSTSSSSSSSCLSDLTVALQAAK